MSEKLLAVLVQQALLLSVAAVVMALARPLLLKRLGAGSVYAAWLLVPALLLTPLLPRRMFVTATMAKYVSPGVFARTATG